MNQNIKALELKNKIIEEQIAFKEKVLANVNHELRTPMNAIIGMCSLLQDTGLTNKQNEYAGIIKRSGDNLLNIINEFLTISSMKAGKLELKLRPFSFAELFEDLNKIFSIRTDEKGIDLKFEIASESSQFYMGDATRVYQILQNLLSNAVKFTNRGAVKIGLKELKSEGNFSLLEMTVSDTGIGIPENKKATIFDSFTQAHTAGDADYMGTGLGLNIVQNLVGFMDGEIGLKSEEGVGTTFTITIPFQKADQNTIEDSSFNKLVVIPDQWKDKRFLMIEDNLANIVYVRELFSNWGLNITFCENFSDGLRKATTTFFDVILSDLKLPDGNGIDLLKQLRDNKDAACHESKFSVITASILVSDKERAAELDIVSYIEKPFVPQKLLNEIHLILEGKLPNNKHILLEMEKPINQESEETDNLISRLQKITKNPKVQLEFLNIFFKQFKLDVIDMEEAIKLMDMNELSKIAHKMKSSMKIFDSIMYTQVSNLEKFVLENVEVETILSEYDEFKKRAANKIPVFEKTTLLLQSTVDNIQPANLNA